MNNDQDNNDATVEVTLRLSFIYLFFQHGIIRLFDTQRLTGASPSICQNTGFTASICQSVLLSFSACFLSLFLWTFSNRSAVTNGSSLALASNSHFKSAPNMVPKNTPKNSSRFHHPLMTLPWTLEFSPKHLLPMF